VLCHVYDSVMSVLCTPLQIKCYQIMSETTTHYQLLQYLKQKFVAGQLVLLRLASDPSNVSHSRPTYDRLF